MNRITKLVIIIAISGACNNPSGEIKKQSQAIESEIVFTDSSGNKIYKEELKNATGSFNYDILGIEGVPENAKSVHTIARRLAQSGKYEKAIQFLLEAQELAPNWPYPYYDLAYTYLLKFDFENALKYYRQTDSIAPRGFYTSKTALYTLEKEFEGKYEKGLYRLYLSLDWKNDPHEKLEMTKLLVETYPYYAPGWNELSNQLDGEERESAIDKGLKLETDNETKGLLLINKAIVLKNRDEVEKAKEILGGIILDSTSTYGLIELGKFMLNSLKEKTAPPPPIARARVIERS